MTDFELDGQDAEETTKPIVQWFDDPVWRVQFVPTAAAFATGCLVGVVAGMALMRLWDRE